MRRLSPLGHRDDLPPGALDIGAGSYHTCALLASGGVNCWGSASQLGSSVGSVLTDSYSPQPVLGLRSGMLVVEAMGGFS